MPIDWTEFESTDAPSDTDTATKPDIDWSQFEPAGPHTAEGLPKFETKAKFTTEPEVEEPSGIVEAATRTFPSYLPPQASNIARKIIGTLGGGAIEAASEAVSAIAPKSKIGQIAKGVSEAQTDNAEFFTSPLGIATLGIGTLPKMAQRAVSLGFATQMASQTPELSKQLGEELGKPEDDRDYEKIAKLVAGGAATIGFTAGAGVHGLAPSRPLIVPPEGAGGMMPPPLPGHPPPLIGLEGQIPMDVSVPKKIEAIDKMLSDLEAEHGPREVFDEKKGKLVANPDRIQSYEEDRLLKLKADLISQQEKSTPSIAPGPPAEGLKVPASLETPPESVSPSPTLPVGHQELITKRNRLFLQELPKHADGTAGKARVQRQIDSIDEKLKEIEQENLKVVGEELVRDAKERGEEFFPIPEKGAPNAETIRRDQGQLRPPRQEPQGGEALGGNDIQQPPPRPPNAPRPEAGQAPREILLENKETQSWLKAEHRRGGEAPSASTTKFPTDYIELRNMGSGKERQGGATGLINKLKRIAEESGKPIVTVAATPKGKAVLEKNGFVQKGDLHVFEPTKGQAEREVLLKQQENAPPEITAKTTAEHMEDLSKMSIAEMGAKFGKWQGRLGPGSSGWANEIGAAVKTQADLDLLIRYDKEFKAKAAAARQAVLDLQAKEKAATTPEEKEAINKQVMEALNAMSQWGSGKVQLPHEAYQAATGHEIGKPEVDRVKFLRDRFWPDYEPPMAPKKAAPPPSTKVTGPESVPPPPVAKPGEPIWMGKPVSLWKELSVPERIKGLSPDNQRQLANSLAFPWDPARPQYKRLAERLNQRIAEVEAAAKPKEPTSEPSAALPVPAPKKPTPAAPAAKVKSGEEAKSKPSEKSEGSFDVSKGATEIKGLVKADVKSDPRLDEPGVTRTAKPNSLVVQFRDRQAYPVGEVTLPLNGDAIMDHRAVMAAIKRRAQSQDISFRESGGVSTGPNGRAIRYFSSSGWTAMSDLIAKRGESIESEPKQLSAPPAPIEKPKEIPSAKPVPQAPTAQPEQEAKTTTVVVGSKEADKKPKYREAGPSAAQQQETIDAARKVLKEAEDREANLNAEVKKIPLGELSKHGKLLADRDKAREEAIDARTALRTAEASSFLAKHEQQIAPFRGQPVERGEQKITAKVLKAQKNDLLAQLDQAIKDAPEESTEKITLDVEGDGVFTVFNTKENLKSFRALAKKSFPESVASGETSKPSGKPKAIPKVEEPDAKDLGKIAGEYVSGEPTRHGITVSYADGTQIVATDGRQLLRIVSDEAPGTPTEPVRIDEKGNVIKAADHGANFPNWKQVLDPGKEFLTTVDTAQLAHLARQGEVFRNTTIEDRDKRGSVPLKIFRNPDGSLGGSMKIGWEEFQHNLQPKGVWLGDYNPDYLWNAATTARKLGTETLDVYAHSRNEGPIEFAGKKHSSIIQPIKSDKTLNAVRAGVAEFQPVKGQPEHVKLAEGYGPLEDPDLYRSRMATSSVSVSMEKGEITIAKFDSKNDSKSDETTIKLSDYTQKGLKEAIKGKPYSLSIDKIKETIKELIRDRDAVIKEAAKRGEAKPITDEGAAHSGPALGIDEFVKKDIAPFLKKGIDVGKALVDIMVDVFSPASKTASRDVDELFKGKGFKEKIITRAAAALDTSKAMFDKLSEPEQIAFIDRVKRGQRQPTPELQRVANLMRKWDDRLYVMAKRYKPGLPYLENHNRVLWKVVPGSPEARGMSQLGVRSKRPWQGSKGFMRRHVLDDMSQGIELGGVPVTYNPVEMFLLHAQDVMKFVAANRAWEGLKNTGSVEWVRTGQKPPDGYVRISDNISKPYFRTPTGLLAKTGEWYAEEGAARMIENYLSRDYIRTGKFGPIGRSLLALKNATTAIELGLSPFHAVFESNEVMGSSIGLGIAKLSSGKLSGVKDILGAPFSPKTTSKLGKMGIKYAKNPTEFARVYPDAYKWFTEKYPEARKLINDLFAGGGQPAMHEEYRVRGIDGFKKSVGEGNYPGAVLRAFPALNELAMKPLFQTYIPRLKVGMFLREYSFELERNSEQLASGKITRPELARKTWAFIEDRFGELNFDNLYWDRTFKSAMQIMFRSVTWKLGNLRGFGKATRDIWMEGLKPLTRGEKPRITMPVAWLAGMALVTSVQASIISKVSTGKYPWELAKDGADMLRNLVFPRIDPDDERQRVSIPTYWRDLVHLAHSPTGYVGSSMTGEWRRLYDDLVNRDFFRHPIYNPNDPMQKKVVASLEHLVPLPFGLSSFIGATQEGVGPERAAAGFMGFTKAPSYVSPSSQNQLRDLAMKWKTESGIPKLVREAQRQATEQFEPSDYTPLRSALRNRNYDAARTSLDKLLEDGHKPKDIYQAMRPLNQEGKPKPFTGSQIQEKYFLQSLTPEQRELYRDAVRERIEIYKRFNGMLKEPNKGN